MKLILRWAIWAGALFVTVWVLQALGMAKLHAGHWYSWFIAVIIMGLVNTFIRPILAFFTAPLNCLTFGLFGVVLNAAMFWLVGAIADALQYPIFQVNNLLGYLVGAILVGILGGLGTGITDRIGEEE
jgi:putative membrane protein